MGGGKGGIDMFITPVQPGRIIFEVKGATEDAVREAFRIAAHKLPFICKVVSKDDLH
jgi:large subunit ribosomal protein L16